MPSEEQDEPNLWDKLLASIESVIDLRVITYVGDVEVSGDLSKPEIRLPTDDKAKALATSINLAQGDITNAIPEQYLAPDQEIIREYHKSQVAQANTIVERNVGLLVELVKNVAGELRGVPARPSDAEDSSAGGDPE